MRAQRHTLRIGTRVSVRVQVRTLVVIACLVVAVIALSVLTLAFGDLGVPPLQLPSALVADSGADSFVVQTLRGPRLLVALGAGAAFGVSGSLFQRVTRNPLGSPDVIGLTAGASAGAVAFGILWPGIVPLPAGAVIGASAAIALVYIATGTGFASPGKLIIAGIGVQAIALSFVQFMLTRIKREQATVLATWLNGSLEARSLRDAGIILLILAVFGTAALVLSRRLAIVEMGDDIADGVGASASHTRTWAVGIAIVLAAGGVAVCGPVAFIALMAPHVARVVARSNSPIVAGLTGAVLLMSADMIVQFAPIQQQLPVGVVTALIGGIFLGGLLISQWRKGAL
ncbi:FecCD family ABC transporter permease [Paramicrobacterium chengjingii]|uniref:Iron chelate uptake ABC transporter family permease subunit n=1 Tax=Paramicrobacterium chengjingii TaxID=2769067 RepID=A0ABX6YFN7_9MICO|nr:iron chelate uptake ABC transporter family permease subunit [Microbacterium chengjingii]QPZ37261.1 iron chelate uptake ABC transporter family permease subunit [Microbacterium chengjingii]